MKRLAELFLARFPLLYRRMLQIAGRGSLEKHIFLSLISSNDIVCDIGANQGYFTQLFSDIVGKDGEVHAFEPGPAINHLKQRTIRMGYRNITINEIALSDKAGTATLHVPGEVDGQSSLRRQECGNWSNQEVKEYSCKVSTLDQYAAMFRKLDFVKCDIEGAELPCIRGALETLRKLKPILFVEVFDEWTKPFGYSPKELIAELQAIGYDSLHVAGSRLTALNQTNFPESANLLCCQTELHQLRLARLRGI